MTTTDTRQLMDETTELLASVGTILAADNGHLSFHDLGVDSLALIEISKRVEDRYGVDVEDRLTADSTPDDLTRILADLRRAAVHAVRRSPAARTENSIEIEAPIAYVWDLLVDVRNWTELFTEYQSVEVLDEGPQWSLFRLTKVPDEQGRVWSWVSRRRWNRETWTARAWRTEPGPFAFMRLQWTFEALGPSRTRMNWFQEFHMRPGAPVDDDAMTLRINANSAIEMIAIKDRIERSRRALRSWSTTRAVTARGGEMRTLVNPGCGSGYGISGFVDVAPGDRVAEHLHPYSEEHILVVSGEGVIDLDGEPTALRPRDAVLVPRNVRHRLRTVGDEPLVAVFALSPLAPRPELGHVDTEGRA